jgi:uncharacterized protein involved in outer membrane biogenesis
VAGSDDGIFRDIPWKCSLAANLETNAMTFAKKTFRVVIALVAVVVIAAVVLTDRILAYVLTTQIAARTGLQTQLGSAHLDIWPSLRVSAYGLELRKPNAQSEAPVFSTDAFAFTLPYNVLIGRTPQISDIGVTHPVVRVEAMTQALHAATPSHSAAGPDVVLSGPFTVTDGVVINEITQRHVTARIEAINVRAQETREGTFVLSLDAKLLGNSVHADALAASSADLRAGRPTRIDIAGSTDTHAPAPLKVRTTLRATATEIAFDDITGTWQSSGLNAAAKVRLGGEAPFLAANLRLDRLDVGTFDVARSAPQDVAQLSDATMDLKSLRLVDATLDFKVDQLRAGGVNMTNIGMKSTLDKGLLRVTLNPADISQGKIAANFTVDASKDIATEAAQVSLTSLKAGPFLSDLAGFKQFDGTLDFRADLTSTGASTKAIVSNLAGNAELTVKNGVVTGHKLPDLFSQVSPFLPAAWRNLSDKIEISSMNAKFNVTHGIASSDNIHVVSPVADVTGGGDVNLVERTFNLRFAPKVKNGSSDARAPSNPVDLGATILVSGPWSDPKVSADLSGLMNNPQKAIEGITQEFLGSPDKSSRLQTDEILKNFDGLLKGFTGDNGLIPKR